MTVKIFIRQFEHGNQGHVIDRGTVERNLRNVHTRVNSEGGCCTRAKHIVRPVCSISGKDYFVRSTVCEDKPLFDNSHIAPYEVMISSEAKLPFDLKPLPEGE
jgi:hypothetical protein